MSVIAAVRDHEKLPAWLAYEYQMIREHSATCHKVWHWSSIPERALRECGFINDHNEFRLKRLAAIQKRKREGGEEEHNVTREYGLDGLAVDEEGVYHGLQAKRWDARRRLTASDLGSFQSVVHNRLRKRDGRSTGILYTSAQLQVDLSDDLACGEAIYVVDMEPEKGCDDNMSIVKDEVGGLALYEPQIAALAALSAHQWTESAALVSLPCGMGKTVVLGHHIRTATAYNLIVVASPLRMHAKQTLRRLLPFLPTDVAVVLVDSDSLYNEDDQAELRGLATCTTSIDVVRAALASHPLVFVSTTFKSLVNVIGRLDQLRSPSTLLVLDEAHNITQNVADVVCNGISHTMLLTATPGILMRERMAEGFRDVYSYSLGDAIRQGFVCDYRIVIPTLRFNQNDENADASLDMAIPPCLQDRADDHIMELVLPKALFLANGMLEQGCVRCVVFCANIAECDVFCTAFRRVCNEYHGIDDVYVASIVASTPCADRACRLRAFEDYRGTGGRRFFSVVTSVRILSEGVDIVTCDSVFLSAPSSDVDGIQSIQRLCRANRRDPKNPSKVAHCFVWCDDMNATASMLYSLRFAGGAELNRDRICVQRSKYEVMTGSGFIADAEAAEQTSTRLLTRVQSIGCICFRGMWYKRLEQVEAYLLAQGKRPNLNASDSDEKKLGKWLWQQDTNYAKNLCIMRDDTVRAEWESFMSRHAEIIDGPRILSWRRTLKKVMAYVSSQGAPPSHISKYAVHRTLGEWMSTQHTNYSTNSQMMKYEIVRAEWEAFASLFAKTGNYIDRWRHMLQQVEAHVLAQGKRPSFDASAAEEKKLAKWLWHQDKNYRDAINIMKNDIVRAEWEAFMSR